MATKSYCDVCGNEAPDKSRFQLAPAPYYDHDDVPRPGVDVCIDCVSQGQSTALRAAVVRETEWRARLRERHASESLLMTPTKS